MKGKLQMKYRRKIVIIVTILLVFVTLKSGSLVEIIEEEEKWLKVKEAYTDGG